MSAPVETDVEDDAAFPDVDELVSALRRTHGQLERCRDAYQGGPVATFAFRQTLTSADRVLKDVDRALKGFSR